MDIGSHTLCLKTANLDASRQFYEALGMELNLVYKDMHVNFDSGTFNLSLMTFLESNCLNFRGADVVAVYDHMRSLGFELDGEPEHYHNEENGSTGVCWLTHDPDGNVLFFDTNEQDTPQFRLSRLLVRIDQELKMLGAESEHFAAFRREIVERFIKPAQASANP